MTRLRVLLSRLLGRGRNPAALDGEIVAHLRMLTADYQRRGLSPADARAAARREFGSVTQLHERYREQRRPPSFDSLTQDLAYAFRQLRHNSGFAAAAVLTLALGIGANTAISGCSTPICRPLPVSNPDQLVQVNCSTTTSRPSATRSTASCHPTSRRSTACSRSASSASEAILRGRGPCAVRIAGLATTSSRSCQRLGRTYRRRRSPPPPRPPSSATVRSASSTASAPSSRSSSMRPPPSSGSPRNSQRNRGRRRRLAAHHRQSRCAERLAERAIVLLARRSRAPASRVTPGRPGSRNLTARSPDSARADTTNTASASSPPAAASRLQQRFGTLVMMAIVGLVC